MHSIAIGIAIVFSAFVGATNRKYLYTQCGGGWERGVYKGVAR